MALISSGESSTMVNYQNKLPERPPSSIIPRFWRISNRFELDKNQIFKYYAIEVSGAGLDGADKFRGVEYHGELSK